MRINWWLCGTCVLNQCIWLLALNLSETKLGYSTVVLDIGKHWYKIAIRQGEPHMFITTCTITSKVCTLYNHLFYSIFIVASANFAQPATTMHSFITVSALQWISFSNATKSQWLDPKLLG